jgi:hypothetical protein
MLNTNIVIPCNISLYLLFLDIFYILSFFPLFYFRHFPTPAPGEGVLLSLQ